jgi:hypothetical protein
MISASQIVLHIADHRIDPLEEPARITHRITAGQYGFMGKSSVSYTGKAAQAIGGHNGCIGERCLLAQRAELGKGESLTRLKRMAIGWPSKLVETAASKGVLPVAPRPERPSCCMPPQ